MTSADVSDPVHSLACACRGCISSFGPPPPPDPLSPLAALEERVRKIEERVGALARRQTATEHAAKGRVR